MTEYIIKTDERCKNLFLPGLGYVELVDNQIRMEIPEPLAINLKKIKGFSMVPVKVEAPKPQIKPKGQRKSRAKKHTTKD